MLTLKASALCLPGIAHGFFGRKGGVSEGIYASLNCGRGSQDDGAHVMENRRRALAALAPNTQLVTCHQIHSAEVVRVAQPWEGANNPEADAMATDRPRIALGILTADCAPILLADGEAGVIGAAHAGWKGALSGVAESVVAAMVGLGANAARIRAAIGPCIGQAAYEVGPEFEARFRAADPDNARFFAPGARHGHFQFDLASYVAQRLIGAGIAEVETIAACTYARDADFYSYRRATHRGEPDYGRDLSAIVIAE
jgi:purine-nucleoside/S-methyl-5'-thioadenosine phosphorylase / adenosine deaminase